MLMAVVNQLNADINGNGQDGLKKKAEAFMNAHDGAEAERTRQHNENKARLDRLNFRFVVFGAIISFFGLVVAIAAIIVTVEISHHAEMDPARIFHSFVGDLELSWLQRPNSFVSHR